MHSYSTYSNEALLELLRTGDEPAFTEIYQRYWEKLLAMAFRLTADQSRSKEIVQELFIGIWERRERLVVSHLESYLATAVKFSFYKHVERARRRRQVEAAELNKSRQASLDKEVEARFLETFISGQVALLPEKCRMVYNYSRVQHMSNAEIAKAMNISEKTVEGHLTKSLRLLKKSVEENSTLIATAIALYECL